MEMHGEYRLERATAKNIHLIIPLYKECFGRAVTTEYLQQKYRTFLTQDGQYFGYIALDAAGNAVAHHTAIPVRFQAGEQTVIAAHSCDSLTSGAHQGKGLFTALGNRVNDMLREAGIWFIYGFSNERSLPAATRKLGWIPLAGITGFKIPVPTLPLENICRRLGFVYPLYLKWADWVIRRHRTDEILPNSMIQGEEWGVLRDADFYAWKSFSYNRRIRLGGVGIWFKIHGPLCVGELSHATEAEVLEAFRRLKKLCFWLGCREIVFQATQGTWHESILARHYPSFPSWVGLHQPYQGDLDYNKLRLSFGDIDSF